MLHKQRTTAAKSRRVSFLLETPAWLVSRWQFHSPAGCCWPAHFGCCCCGSGWSNGHWGGWHRPRGHRGGLGWGGVATWACRSGLVVLWTSNASISVTRKRSKCRKAGFLSWLVGVGIAFRGTPATPSTPPDPAHNRQSALRIGSHTPPQAPSTTPPSHGVVALGP